VWEARSLTVNPRSTYAGTAWSTKKYLNIELLKDQQTSGLT